MQIGRNQATMGGQPSKVTTKAQRRGKVALVNGQVFSCGFTLVELMIVLTLILILASFALPAYNVAMQRAREAVLREDLNTLRHVIDEFTVDKQRPPESLQELVETGYLRGGVPLDPITHSSDTWQVEVEEVPLSADQAQAGIVDVHSGSDAVGLDGTPYNSW